MRSGSRTEFSGVYCKLCGVLNISTYASCFSHWSFLASFVASFIRLTSIECDMLGCDYACRLNSPGES